LRGKSRLGTFLCAQMGLSSATGAPCMFFLVPLLVLAFALFMFLMAWLSGHRTLLPAAIRPAWFWYPGVVMLFSSGAIALLPSVVNWNRCGGECQLEGELQVAYQQCVLSSTASIGADMRRKDAGCVAEDGTAVKCTEEDVTTYLNERAEDIAGQCEQAIVGTCVQMCFDLWRNPEGWVHPDAERLATP